MDRAELEQLDREGLVARAQAAGIRRARVLTRPELIDELLRIDPAVDQTQLKKSRGFFGIARDLLSRVVERGLHLPDAADRLRVALGNPLPHGPRPEPQAVPTVTLAEIYAAQGHKLRAIETLVRVLEAEPEHGAARVLIEKLQASDYVAPPPPLPPEPDEVRDEIGAHLGESKSGEVEEAEAVAEHAETAAVKATEAQAIDAEASEELAVQAPETPASAPATPRVEEPTTLPGAPVVTECVAIPIANGSYVWWRLSEAARRVAVGGSFFVRALVLLPTWDGPQRETRDVACDATAGELILRGLPERAVVRVAIGIMEAGEFVPLAHSPALESSESSEASEEDKRIAASRELVQWTPEGVAPVGRDDPNAASIARAAERAARTTGHRDRLG
jgi:hypothetical protein